VSTDVIMLHNETPTIIIFNLQNWRYAFTFFSTKNTRLTSHVFTKS